MKKLLFFILVFLVCINFNAQRKFNSFVTFSPFKQGISIAPRWQGGYIYRVSKRFLVGADLGIGAGNLSLTPFSKKMNDGGEIRDYFSLEVAPEIYFQLNPNSKNVLMFASGEFFYVYHQQNLDDVKSFSLQNPSYYYNVAEKADYQRQKYGFNVNFNTFFPIGNRFGMMLTTGLGILGRRVHYSNPTNVSISNGYDDDESFFIDPTSTALSRGNFTDVSVRADLKLMYRF